MYVRVCFISVGHTHAQTCTSRKVAVLAKKNGRVISPRYPPLTIFWFSLKTGGSGSTQQPSFPSLAQPVPDVIGSSSQQPSGHMTEPVYHATCDTDDYRPDPGPNMPRQQLWATSIQHYGTSQLTETTSEISANQEYKIPALSYQSEEKAVEEEEEEEHMRKGELCETDLRRKLMQKHQLMRTAEVGVEYEQQQLQQHEEEEAVDQDKEEEEEEDDEEEVLVSEQKGMGKGLEVVVGWQGRAVSRKRRVCYYGNK